MSRRSPDAVFRRSTWSSRANDGDSPGPPSVRSPPPRLSIAFRKIRVKGMAGQPSSHACMITVTVTAEPSERVRQWAPGYPNRVVPYSQAEPLASCNDKVEWLCMRGRQVLVSRWQPGE